MLPDEAGQTRSIETLGNPQVDCSLRQLGLNRLSLATEFPIINATYGFSRPEYSPQECRPNPFHLNANTEADCLFSLTKYTLMRCYFV